MQTSPPTALIVGASSGIGRALANALAREHRRVALTSRRLDALERVAREVTAFGGEAQIAVSDVRDPASIRQALDELTAGGVVFDLVVLSSGISQATHSEHFQADAFEEVIQTNLMGVAHWLEALQPLLRAQPNGSTVAVISSLSADRCIPGFGGSYSASKAAVSQLLDGLRAPWREQQIRLVTVSPGFVATPMTDGLDFTPGEIYPEDAAAIILKGIRDGHSVIRFPQQAALAMGLIRWLPAVWLDNLYKRF